MTQMIEIMLQEQPFIKRMESELLDLDALETTACLSSNDKSGVINRLSNRYEFISVVKFKEQQRRCDEHPRENFVIHVSQQYNGRCRFQVDGGEEVKRLLIAKNNVLEFMERHIDQLNDISLISFFFNKQI